MKIGSIIQARMGSTRLPGKVMNKLEGRTVLSHVIERVSQSKLIKNNIIIATTELSRDDIIKIEALNNGVQVFRGSEDDVLSRYYYAAKQYEMDVIVRITSDCPLIDPLTIDRMINHFVEGRYSLVTNAGSDPAQRTYPRGLDAEVFSIDALNEAFLKSVEPYQREHVTPYIYENLDKIYYYKNDVDHSKHRWTLDTEEDMLLINSVYRKLYKGKHDFFLKDIIELFKKEPDLYKINAHIEQKKIK